MRLRPELGAQVLRQGGCRLGAGQHQRIELQHRIGAAVLPLLGGEQRRDAGLQLGGMARA